MEEAGDVVRWEVVQGLEGKNKGAELNTLGHWQPVELLKKRRGMSAFGFFWKSSEHTYFGSSEDG